MGSLVHLPRLTGHYHERPDDVCRTRLEYEGQATRREQFLAEMNAVIPWPRLLALIAPHYPAAGRGRQPLGLEKMLRIYFLQQ